MANIQIIGNINSTSNVSRYSSDDTNLIGSQNIQESFDIYNDYIEYYVYDINGNILDVDYEYVSYKLPTDNTLNPSYTPPPNSKGNITNSDIQLNNGLNIKSVATALANNGATTLSAGTIVVTTNATGLGAVFVSNGTPVRQLAFVWKKAKIDLNW